MTGEQVKNITSKCPYNQGIFVEPYGIPVTIKEPVIYMRYETGGVSGGSCWDSSNPKYYSVSEVPNFEVLDLVIKELCPNISYLKFKEIEKLIHTNEETDHEYYGNCTDYMIKYIKLSELENLLNESNQYSW